MAPIRILHASDLHLAHKEKQRSFPDKFSDGLRRTLREVKQKTRSKTSLISALGSIWSDLEAMASSYDVSILKRFAEFVSTEVNNKRLDGVILTGDIATTGDPKDIDRIDKFFNEPPHPDPERAFIGRKSRQATLSFISPPDVFLKFFAGNHDRYVRRRTFGKTRKWKLPLIVRKVFDVGGTEFDRIRFKKDTAPKTRPVEAFSKEKDLGGGRKLVVWVLMADFTLKDFDDHEQVFGWLAQGKVYERALEILVDLTERVKAGKDPDKHQCILWACHFPPQFPNARLHSTLLDGDKLIKAANDLGVRAILTGHTHEQTRFSRPGMQTEVICCGTTTQFEPNSRPGGRYENDLTKGNHFQILNIDVEKGGKISLTVENYRYTHSQSSGTEDDGMVSGHGIDQTGWKRI